MRSVAASARPGAHAGEGLRHLPPPAAGPLASHLPIPRGPQGARSYWGSCLHSPPWGTRLALLPACGHSASSLMSPGSCRSCGSPLAPTLLLDLPATWPVALALPGVPAPQSAPKRGGKCHQTQPGAGNIAVKSVAREKWEGAWTRSGNGGEGGRVGLVTGSVRGLGKA